VQLCHPLSPLAPSAALGIATIEEVAGHAPEAQRIYEAVVADYPKSFQAPQAAFAAARLLEGSGKLTEARKQYEDLITGYPDSAWKPEAQARLEHVNQQIKFKPPASSGPG
jgi:TolA-binding protein